MPNGVLLTAASAAEHPLIDLDFTVFVQLVLFGLTAFVATRFLFRPYLRMREDRSAGIEGARDEASRMSAQADAQLADYETKLDQARARRGRAPQVAR
jgi:F0F1-type ATP synthase membrane subunit b/b'